MGLFSGFLLKTLVLAGRQQEWTTMIRYGVMVLSEVFSDLHNSSTYDNKGDVKVSHQS